MYTTTTDTAIACNTERAVLHALLYFEIFSYPLTQEEVFQFCTGADATEAEVLQKLQHLAARGLVFQYGKYYQTVQNSAWVASRLEYNSRANQFLPVAQRRAAFIGKFPFVRGVFVSGSLSKLSMRADSDIDFFVVTEPGRLWLTRTLLVLFKKIFLFNSHKLFCINYFIDTNHLGIEEKNLFTATETVTLLPMYGREYFEDFRQANAWAWAQFPHFPLRETNRVPGHSRNFLKRLMEKLLAGRTGAWLDDKAMQLTVRFWQRKFKYLDKGSFDIALKSRRYVSKHHPLHFQAKVLDRFEARARAFEPPESL